MLGHLWCSTLQGQLQMERGVVLIPGVPLLGCHLPGWEGTRGGRQRGWEPDRRVWCAHVALWQQCGWGRCVVKERGRLPQPAGCGPNIFAAHTPAVSPATTGPVASIVNQQSEAVRECLAPTLLSCLDPYRPWVTEVLEEARGLGGSRSLLWETVGCWGFFLISCTGSRYIRNFVSALTAV